MSNVLLCRICTYCSAFKASTWKARRSNQSILKEISPEYSLEGLMLKLKLQYFGHLMWIADSLEKTLMLGKTEDRRRRGWQRMRCLDGITHSTHMSLSKLWEILKDREAWHVAVHVVAERQMTQQWTTKRMRNPRSALSSKTDYIKAYFAIDE